MWKFILARIVDIEVVGDAGAQASRVAARAERLKSMFPVRTQDLEPWFEENSNAYIFSGESFLGTKARIGSKPIMFETPKLESVDIDGPEDWALAEALALQIHGKQG